MANQTDEAGGIVERDEFETGFLMVPNETAQDGSLTPAALGLLVFIESLPRGWKIRDGHVRAHFGIGRDALRSIYRTLEMRGYARRIHRVRQPNGTFLTITKIRRKPIFLNESDHGRFSTDGSSASGFPADGKATTLKKHIGERPARKKHKKEICTQKPAPQALSKSESELARSFFREFGFSWVAENHLGESEALRIARVHKLDGGEAQRAAAEFAAEALRGFRKSPGDAWFWLCRQQASTGLAHTHLGDENLQGWG